MSIKSYQKNVERGVTGPDTSTCFAAAIEQLAANYRLKPELYLEYEIFCEWYNTLDEKTRRLHVEHYEDVIEDIVRPLGGLAIQDIIFKRVLNSTALARNVRDFTRAGYSVVVDISVGPSGSDSIPHSVGIVPIQDSYCTVVSTHVPRALQGVIHLEKVGQRLLASDDPSVPSHPMYTANLMAIPIV